MDMKRHVLVLRQHHAVMGLDWAFQQCCARLAHCIKRGAAVVCVVLSFLTCSTGWSGVLCCECSIAPACLHVLATCTCCWHLRIQEQQNSKCTVGVWRLACRVQVLPAVAGIVPELVVANAQTLQIISCLCLWQTGGQAAGHVLPAAEGLGLTNQNLLCCWFAWCRELLGFCQRDVLG